MASVHTHKKRARLAGATGEFTADQILEVFRNQNGICAMCLEPIDLDTCHKDHKTPLSRGGSNDISNVHLVCAPCNRSKYNKTFEEYMSAA